MEDGEENNFDYRKPSVALIIILGAVILAVLLIDWIFNFFKERM